MQETSSRFVSGGNFIKTFAGDSKEEKPTENLCTGSYFYEVDTGKAFCFLASDQTWYPVGGGS